MNLYNVIISLLVCAASCTALYFTMQSDAKKENLMRGGEVKSQEIVSIAKSYDSLLRMNQDGKSPALSLRRDTLTLQTGSKKHNINALRDTLGNMKVIADLSETYHKNMIACIVQFAEMLKLDVVSTAANLQKFTDRLNDAAQADEALSDMVKQAEKIRERNNALIAQFKEVAKNLKMDVAEMAAVETVSEDYNVCFENILATVKKVKDRRAEYETALSVMSANAGLEGAMMLGGDDEEARNSLNAMTKGIQDKYTEIEQKQSELNGLKEQIASLETKRGELDQSITALNEKKSGLDDQIKGLRSQIWAPDEGEPIPYIIQDNDYKLKYGLVRGKVMTVKPKWKMLQLDVGRALVVEQPIGTTGKTNKILCPIFPGYEVDIARPTADGMNVIGKAKITSVSEFSSIADVLSITQPIKEGDVILFSAPVIEKIHTDLGGTETVAEDANANEDAADAANDDDVFE